MRIHELKIEDIYADAIVAGLKKFEIRKNDRDFQPNDSIILISNNFVIAAKIGFITDYEQKEGYVVFSLLKIEVGCLK